jgi:hypothetical protein
MRLYPGGKRTAGDPSFIAGGPRVAGFAAPPRLLACENGRADGMLDSHIAILQRLQALSTELIELSGRDTASLSDGEIEALTRRLGEIRTEIARLREEFKETLN